MEYINQMRKREDFLVLGLDRVINWNLTARGSHQFSDEDVARQKSFVAEELKETIQALADKNRKEIIDGICDMFVVATYWNFLKVMKEQHDRIKPEDRVSGHFDDGFKEMVIRDARMDTLDYLKPGSYWSDEEPVELITYLENCLNDDRSHTFVEIVATLMEILDFNAELALGRVLDSNDSKMPTVQELIKALAGAHFMDGPREAIDILEFEAAQLNAEHAGRYSGIVGGINTITERVVFKDSNNKIMKPCTFIEPDLKDL
ncbi:hypothetical protein CHUUTOTORO_00790 [Serratia phage vB_SmaM-ChuuTotoro]|nr:hypothetical protein CHUUTOTORO_00790 [Serratia phage vB_SmaM-ChuuTotoro]